MVSARGAKREKSGEVARQSASGARLEVRTRNQAAVAVVRKVNQITRGWAGPFHYANSTHVFGKQQNFVRSSCRQA